MKVQVLNQYCVRLWWYHFLDLTRRESSLKSWHVLNQILNLEKSCACLCRDLISLAQALAKTWQVLYQVLSTHIFSAASVSLAASYSGLLTKLSKVKTEEGEREHFQKVFLIENEQISDITQRYQSWVLLSTSWKMIKFDYGVNVWEILSWYMLISETAWSD